MGSKQMGPGTLCEPRPETAEAWRVPVLRSRISDHGPSLARVPDDAIDNGPAARRVEVALAARRGEIGAVRAALADKDARVRAAALSALARLAELSEDEVAAAINDVDPIVRRRICELSTTAPHGAFETLLFDADASVVESAAFACGEQAIAASIDALVSVATDHHNALCRESAVAALGVLGIASGLEAILAATTDVAAVRRRAVIALSNFEGDQATTALQRALQDRDWQVRQAAEDVLDINRTSTR